MPTEMGEYLVGAYLRHVEGCDRVDYNVHFPGGGEEGLKELDVIGYNYPKRTVFLCEVTTQHSRASIQKPIFYSSEDCGQTCETDGICQEVAF